VHLERIDCDAKLVPVWYTHGSHSLQYCGCCPERFHFNAHAVQHLVILFIRFGVLVGVLRTLGFHLRFGDLFPINLACGLFPIALPALVVPHICQAIDEIPSFVAAWCLYHTFELLAFVLSTGTTGILSVLRVELLALLAELLEEPSKLTRQLFWGHLLLQGITNQIV